MWSNWSSKGYHSGFSSIEVLHDRDQDRNSLLKYYCMSMGLLLNLPDLLIISWITYSYYTLGNIYIIHLRNRWLRTYHDFIIEIENTLLYWFKIQDQWFKCQIDTCVWLQKIATSKKFCRNQSHITHCFNMVSLYSSRDHIIIVPFL